MSKTRLLQSVCAAVMLAALPAFAQTNSQPGDTGLGGAPNNPTAVPNGPSTAVPAERMGSPHGAMNTNDYHGSMDHHASRHAARMRSQDSVSEGAAVDRLNEQSYMAARSGQAFTGAVPSDMSAPGRPASTNDMSGGSMSHGDMTK